MIMFACTCVCHVPQRHAVFGLCVHVCEILISQMPIKTKLWQVQYGHSVLLFWT